MMLLALSWQVITVSCASTFQTFRDARARAMTDLPAGRSPREFTLTLACLIQFIHSGLRSWMSNVDTCHKSGLPVPVVFFFFLGGGGGGVFFLSFFSLFFFLWQVY